MMRLFTKIPELTILVIAIVIGYGVIAIFSQIEGTEVLSPSDIGLILFASFVISTLIAIVAVIAGVGGGVLFTPIMLAFTSIDTLIIRATGLVVAMFSGLISSGPFMRNGLANARIVFYCAVPFAVGGIGGGSLAIYLDATMGETADAIVRLSLGILLLFVAYLFIRGGSKREYPQEKVDRFSDKLKLGGSFWEESLQKRINYRSSRVLLGGFLFLFVGLCAGFFGLGGGWAAVPVLNIVMATPLKVAAATSGVTLAIGNAAAIWPYIIYGALIVLFAVPWMLGQVVGGIMGAHLLSRVNVRYVRYFLIAFLIFSCIRLITRGIEGLAGIDIPVI
jgi:uncharacterized membrane protein YfcA